MFDTINLASDQAVRDMIGYQPRERRGKNGGFSRVELEQMRALIFMGVSDAKIQLVMECGQEQPRRMRKTMGTKNVHQATCHPERPHAAKGMCRKCYDITRRMSKVPSCHPERKYKANGMCAGCYLKASRKAPAPCPSPDAKP